MDDRDWDGRTNRTEDRDENHPLACGIPLENAGVATDAESDLLTTACSSDLKEKLGEKKDSRRLTNNAPAENEGMPLEGQADLWQRKSAPDEKAEWNTERTK